MRSRFALSVPILSVAVAASAVFAGAQQRRADDVVRALRRRWAEPLAFAL
jgi:hypothetical protein